MPTETRLTCVTACLPHLFPGAACYGHGHLFAPVRHAPVSRYARYVERSSSSHPVLVGFRASAVPRAENLGRAGPLDAGLDHRLALSPRAQRGLLEYPSAGGV